MTGLDVRVEQLSGQEVKNMMAALMERNKAQGQLLVAWKRRLKEQVNVISNSISLPFLLLLLLLLLPLLLLLLLLFSLMFYCMLFLSTVS